MIISSDADVLRRAAVVLKRESRRPKTILLAALCRMLNDLADKLAAPSVVSKPEDPQKDAT